VPRGKKTGGRQKGTPNKHKAAFRDQLRSYCDSIGVDPHRYMADMIADSSEVVYGVDGEGKAIKGPAVKPDLKLQAAKELAQYIEPKLKAVEHSGEVDHTISIVEVSLE
jgi:hypothetical protein